MCACVGLLLFVAALARMIFAVECDPRCTAVIYKPESARQCRAYPAPLPGPLSQLEPVLTLEQAPLETGILTTRLAAPSDRVRLC
jgi:hypothetical protein